MSFPDPEIRPLGDALINQIAAGEVIERPASALKELVENSLDAGATEIDVEVDAGGIERLQVRDNGRGIRRDELALALSRHCTSKIARAEDLEAIASLGFRGEALASLCAVAELTLTSRHHAADTAFAVHCAPGGAISAPEPRPHPPGTTVTVARLFATIPGRRRFLKRPQTELLHVQQLVRRLAFCHPEIGFTLSVDGRRVARYAPARDEVSAARRWRAVFGPEFQRAARPVAAETAQVRIAGWVGGPELASSQIELQYLAVNGRMIRDRQLAHAIRLAYDTLLPPGRYAVYALHLAVPAEALDANVHPAKTEVRFHALRDVHDALYSAVRHALEPAPAAAPMRYELSRPPRRELRAAEAGPVHVPRVPDAAPVAELPALVAPLGRRFVLVRDRRGDGVLDVCGLAVELFARRLRDACAAGPVATRPLLFPPTVQSPALAADEARCAAFATLGLDLSVIGPASLVLRAVPIVLPDVDPQAFAAALGSATEEPSAALRSALTAAFRLPESAAERRSGFERLLAAAAGHGIDAGRHLRELDEAALAQWFETRGPRDP
ncbi:MAG: DNA mismatch repair endonuclease MutL [Gammaproteobacteria bacterium]|nr:DNA mismatch repair endonuclease MutL [Gammaproteobacteria bacterium]